jgi:hypothetical protein
MEAGSSAVVLRPISLLLAALLSTVLLISSGAAFASSWTLTLQAGSAAEAQAQAAPLAPTGVSAACVSSTEREVKVTWGAVAHTSSYTVYDSTTSSSSGYASVATGQTGTSWTSGTLSAGNYWFKVAAYVGTKWVSANSAATAETTIKTSGTECTQP